MDTDTGTGLNQIIVCPECQEYQYNPNTLEQTGDWSVKSELFVIGQEVHVLYLRVKSD